MDAEGFVEIDLGEFFVTRKEDIEGKLDDATVPQILVVRFHLYGVVHEHHEDQFVEQLEERRERMRDTVIASIQASELQHLTDPTLGWMRSELVPGINRTLRTRHLHDVVFSAFSIEHG